MQYKCFPSSVFRQVFFVKCFPSSVFRQVFSDFSGIRRNPPAGGFRQVSSVVVTTQTYAGSIRRNPPAGGFRQVSPVGALLSSSFALFWNTRQTFPSVSVLQTFPFLFRSSFLLLRLFRSYFVPLFRSSFRSSLFRRWGFPKHR